MVNDYKLNAQDLLSLLWLAMKIVFILVLLSAGNRVFVLYQNF